ncbi:MAG: hypothetical protein ACTSPY_02590 [Candidatus Helarchaeota archaeon]
MKSKKNDTLLNFNKIMSNINQLDTLLRGGFEPGIIHLFGNPNTGKSNFAMQLTISAILKYNAEPIWFDTNGNFDFNRMLMMVYPNQTFFNNFKLFRPKNYNEFKDYIMNLDSIVNFDTKIIVIDPITYYYRLMVNKNNWFMLRHELGEIIIAKLIGLSVFKKLSVVLINQITGKDLNSNEQQAVCNNIIDRHAKYTIYFHENHGLIMTLKKIKNVSINKSIPFKIYNHGLI